ncbi:MAG: HGxxPAAW family protein [Candidatus Nanopelagicales bacterium]
MTEVQARDESQMRDPEEGRTPAAWTAVTIMLIAFCVGTLGVCIAQPWMFWLGIALLVVGAIVGKVMAMMGLGQYPKGSS